MIDKKIKIEDWDNSYDFETITDEQVLEAFDFDENKEEDAEN